MMKDKKNIPVMATVVSLNEGFSAYLDILKILSRNIAAIIENPAEGR